MNILLKFLFSLIAHTLWKRIGGGGAVPPIRLPRSKRIVNIPVFTSWQLMVVTWLARKAWHRYGDTVKTRLVNAENPVVRRVGSYVPDSPGAAAAAPSVAQNGAAPSQAKNQGQTPPAAQTGAAPAAATPSRSYQTQQLDDDDDAPLLSSLRKGNSPASS